MNGKRATRVQGTDGSDFQYRQRVATKYEKVQHDRKFIVIVSAILTLFSIFNIIGSTVKPAIFNESDTTLSIIWTIVLGINTAVLCNGYVCLVNILFVVLSVVNALFGLASGFVGIPFIMYNLVGAFLSWRAFKVYKSMLVDDKK